MDVFYSLPFFITFLLIWGIYSRSNPISEPRGALQNFYPAYITFNMEMNVFYSLQFFDYLLTSAYLEHLTPG